MQTQTTKSDTIVSSPPQLDVYGIAQLVCLTITPAEAQVFQAQLNEFVASACELEALDVTGVTPLVYGREQLTVMNTDEPRPGLAREVVLANAPRHDAEQFLVPKIM